MSPGRIVFLNRFYWPDEPATAQLLADLAESLAAHGHAVTVIASRPARSVPTTETRHGVAILRVRSARSGRRSLAARAVDFLTFHLAAGWRLLRTVRRGDTLVAMTDPPLIGVTAWLVARLRGARLLHWVQDIYPEIAAELSGQRWVLALRPLRDAAWRSAAACVVPGADMSAAPRRAGVPDGCIPVIANWAPVGLVPPPVTEIAAQRRAWDLDGKFVAAYSGNLGRVHDLEPLLEVAASLRDDPSFVVIFVGDGARRLFLEAAVRTRRLANVRFFPPQPRARLAVTLAAGDVHFVTLQPGAERWVLPSKLYGVAAVGRPVIFVGEAHSEVARLVVTHRFGAAFDRGEPAAIAAELRRLRTAPDTRAALGIAALRFAAAGPVTALASWHRVLTAGLAGTGPGC